MRNRSLLKKVFVFCLLVLCIFVFFAIDSFRHPRLCFRDVCLKVEVARNEKQRMRGLMLRHSLGQDRGMLFVFPGDDYWAFWMKDTLIPLDIIWLDKNGKVVDIVEGAQPYKGENPPSFRPVYPARFALEVNSGFVKNNGIKIGSHTESFVLDFFRQKS